MLYDLALSEAPLVTYFRGAATKAVDRRREIVTHKVAKKREKDREREREKRKRCVCAIVCRTRVVPVFIFGSYAGYFWATLIVFERLSFEDAIQCIDAKRLSFDANSTDVLHRIVKSDVLQHSNRRFFTRELTLTLSWCILYNAIATKNTHVKKNYRYNLFHKNIILINVIFFFILMYRLFYKYNSRCACKYNEKLQIFWDCDFSLSLSYFTMVCLVAFRK